jgi:hypothetical protein
LICGGKRGKKREKARQEERKKASRFEEMRVVHSEKPGRDNATLGLIGMHSERMAAVDATLLLTDNRWRLLRELRVVAHIIPAPRATDSEHGSWEDNSIFIRDACMSSAWLRKEQR